MNGEKHRHPVLNAVVAAVLVWPSFALAEAPWLYGIHWYGSSGSTDVEAMSGGKGLWVLENVNTWSSPSASGQKSKFATEVARGHTIIVRLQPRWGWAVPAESEMEAYLLAVRDVAQELKDQVHIWQIGNEMNNPGEYGGTFLPPEDYISRFKRIRNAIHDVISPLGPQMVLLGPPSSFEVAYQTAMLSLLDPPDVDGFAIHAYGLDPDTVPAYSVNNFATAVDTHLSVIDGHGFAYKPVWITEFDRCVNPDTDAQEAVSAQFLHMAYDWLAGWNVTPGTHPVMGAMWFVYPDDPNWSCFSILHHKGGPSGPDADLWEAFQYAAGKNYVAPAYVQVLKVAPAALSREFTYGQAPSDDQLTIVNLGAGVMDYLVTDDVPWLSAAPAAGSSTGEVDVPAIVYDTASLSPGHHHATIEVNAPGAIDGQAFVELEVRVRPYPGDLDADFDVDMNDYGLFQNCLRGPNVPSNGIDCDLARFDDDIDVDAADLTLFLGCVTGPNLPADPDCLN